MKNQEGTVKNRPEFWKSVIKRIIGVFATAISLLLIVIIVLMIFRIGYLLGFNEGRSRAIDYYSGVFDYSNPTETPVVAKATGTPTRSSEDQKTQESGYLRNVAWGGPQLWEAANKKRVEMGVNPLNQKDELCTIASIRLNELLELGKLDGHEGFSNMAERRPDLSYIFERYSISEFLAAGADTPEETVDLWLNTLAHKKLLTGGEYVWGCIYAQNSFAVAIAAY